MKSGFLLAAATALLISATSYAQEVVKDTEKAAKSTAHATEKAAKKTVQGTEKAADATVSGTKKADRKSTRLNSSHRSLSRMPSSA